MKPDHILQSYDLGPINLANRVVMAPLTRGTDNDSSISHDTIKHSISTKDCKLNKCKSKYISYGNTKIMS